MGLSGEGRGGGGGGRLLKTCMWWSGRTSSTPRNSVTCSGSLDFNGGDGIFYKGDNSTLAPAFLVLSVGFISSGIEPDIHCQVGLLDGAYIICRFVLGISEALFSSDELLLRSSVLI